MTDSKSEASLPEGVDAFFAEMAALGKRYREERAAIEAKHQAAIHELTSAELASLPRLFHEFREQE